MGLALQKDGKIQRPPAKISRIQPSLQKEGIEMMDGSIVQKERGRQDRTCLRGCMYVWMYIMNYNHPCVTSDKGQSPLLLVLLQTPR